MEEFLDTDTFCTKEKIKGVITRHCLLQPSGDGDRAQGACRLCAGERGLRGFCDPRGERYDSLLMRCFGFVVTPADCLICERCATLLRSTERFKALVEAAFEGTPSDSLTPASSTTCIARIEPTTQTIKRPITIESASCEAIKKKQKMLQEKKTQKPASVAKKDIPCSICKQRYTVLVPAGGWPAGAFSCARCKSRGVLRKCNVPCAVALNCLAARGDAGRHRIVAGTAPKSGQKKRESATKNRRYDCSQCAQRFTLPHRLAEHMNIVHRDSMDTKCVVCGKDLETQIKLGKHLKIHTGEYHQCEVCMSVFKSKQALQTHLIGHKRARASGRLR